MFHFMICDKDEIFCRKEEKFISDFCIKQNMEVKIDIFHTGEEIVALGKKVSEYDAAFLDTRMENVNSIDLGNWLNGAAPGIVIVFVSSNMSHVLDGYKVGAIRYIMKEETQFADSMEECLRYILRRLQEKSSDYIDIASEKIRIAVGKILYIESRAHKITYHLMENNDTRLKYTVYGKLADEEKRLLQFGFCRVHQSYLVNMNYVLAVERYRLVFLNGKEVQISKSRYKDVEERFVRLKGTF